MRSRKRPLRAASRAVIAAKAWPRCSSPVGLGAKRVTIIGGIYRAPHGERMAARPITGPRLAPARGAATHLVVLCHGYGADGNDLIGLAPHWQRLLPTVAFVSPNAPERVPGSPGYQWFPISRLDPREMQKGVESAAETLDAFLDAELARLELTGHR